MTKRSAIILAGGVAVALVAIVVALALNLGALRASSASAARSQKPIVKTIVKTVHHRVKPRATGPGTVIVHRPTTSASGAGASHGDDAFEHGSEGGDD